jgi:hypothetical protein
VAERVPDERADALRRDLLARRIDRREVNVASPPPTSYDFTSKP